MIHENLNRLLEYIPPNKRQKVKVFLDMICADMQEKTYLIDGEDIYARVMSYNTKIEEDCDIEAHERYVDIQFSLKGEEGISIYSRDNMDVLTRDVEKDFLIFINQNQKPQVRVCNEVGWFTLIHTYEAHRPQESINQKCEVVKKCVIKIKEKCYE